VFSRSLVRNRTLEKLILYRNLPLLLLLPALSLTPFIKGVGLGAEGAIELAKAVQVHPTLRDLDLGANKIGQEGAEALAKALESNTVLQKLSLYDNHLGNAGVAPIFAALAQNSSLQTLNLMCKKQSFSPPSCSHKSPPLFVCRQCDKL